MTQTTANSSAQSSEMPAAVKSAAETKKPKSAPNVPVKAPVKKTRQSALPVAKTPKTRAKPAAKVPAKPAVKVLAKPAGKAPAKPATQGVTKPIKEKKVKVVRDSFTLPKTELLQIADMKKRAMALGVEVKKSELIRAGLQALSILSDAPFKKALGNVPTIKTGRPAKA